MGGDEWDVTDEASFLACYRATVADVFRYAAMLCGRDRATAEDLVQDVYLRAMRRVRSQDLTALTVAYLTTAVRHRHLDLVKSRERETRRMQLVARPDRATVAESDLDPNFATSARLADLSERERTAIVLRFVDDLSVAGVASAMGINRRAAESLLARATRRLRRGERHHG